VNKKIDIDKELHVHVSVPGLKHARNFGVKHIFLAVVESRGIHEHNTGGFRL
jgi:hypothetical protein